MKKFFLFSIFFHFLPFLHAQSLDLKEVIIQIEDHMVDGQKDSVNQKLSLISEKTEYLNKLLRIHENRASYKDYDTFISKVGNRYNQKWRDLSGFINSNLIEPKSNKIDLNFVKIKWIQISKLRDYASIELASIEQKKLESYVVGFSKIEIDVQKAVLLLNTHKAVLYAIEKDVENGKKLCLDALVIAREIKDRELEITYLYHLRDFLILEKKLQEYIDSCEESLNIEEELPNKSNYYVGTVTHLLDAITYKKGDNKRVKELLEILWKDEYTKHLSLVYYSKEIRDSELNTSFVKDAFELFKVKDVRGFVKKTSAIGKDKLNSNDFFYLLEQNSVLLEKYGFLKEALRYKDKIVNVIRKTYSEDLTQSLADFKTKQATKEKDIIIKSQKKKTTLYVIILGLMILLFLITVFGLVKKQKKSKILNQKNIIINKTLKEKDFLIKEIHHRVKNNFQLVSSLLDLQTKGVEDKKARELAIEGKNRIRSMALIHQKLYQNNEGLINFDEYVRLLVEEIQNIYLQKGRVVKNSIISENIKLDLDTAIPLGLIINELITNAYKYAFDNSSDNQLSISILQKKKDEYFLKVSDSGDGIKAGVSVKKMTSLGLRLVNRLVRQLSGSLKYYNNNGATFEITFKDSGFRKSIL